MTSPEPELPTIPPQRLEALADGVFAIIMTLLVFQLGVPIATEAEALESQLAEMWPSFLIYVLSFLVLGVFWLIHHIVFDTVERYDTTLIWLNIVFLMFAAVIPFSTGLFVEHGVTTVTAIIYGSNMAAPFMTAWAIFWYATSGHRLASSDLDPEVIRGGRQMGFVYMVCLLFSIAVSLISPLASYVLYGLFVAVIILFTVIGRAEVVMTWGVGSDTMDAEGA
jgi:uncharacterized membrane protein